jgi:quercetin dioxygenase-like cupin family protein
MASPFHTSVVLRGEQTGGELSAVVNTVPAGWAGPPLHRHDFDETFYVLDGELTFQLGAEIRTAGPGALAFARGGIPHTLANLGGASARYLLLCTPAGFERYFDRLAAEAAGADPPLDAEADGPIPPTTVLGPSLAEREDPTPAGSLEPGVAWSTRSRIPATRRRGS